jgi:sugar phosphate isomerase/epimerase
MHNVSTRRDFLRTSALTGFALGSGVLAARAIEPIARKGAPKMMLGLAAYSFRNFFADNQGKKTGKDFDLFKFVDYCGEQNCAAEVTSYYFPQPITDEFLLQLKHHAFMRGVSISGSAVGNTFTVKPGADRDKQIADLKKWIDHAALLAAPHIRIFAGNAPKDLSKDEAKKLCVAAIEECCDYAGKRGVVLGLENHGGIVAEPADLLDMVRAVKSPWFGINLDTGNFHTDDPYADLAACAPYAVNVQVKVEVKPKGAKASQPTDLKLITKLLRDANYQGYVALEYESAEDPWKAVPRWLGELRAAIVG